MTTHVVIIEFDPHQGVWDCQIQGTQHAYCAISLEQARQTALSWLREEHGAADIEVDYELKLPGPIEPLVESVRDAPGDEARRSATLQLLSRVLTDDMPIGSADLADLIGVELPALEPLIEAASQE